MGRFSHEAIAVDQRTGIVYLTEDPGAGTAPGSTASCPRPATICGGRPPADARRPRPAPARHARGPDGRRAAGGRRWFDIAEPDPDVREPRRPAQRLPAGLRAGRRAVQPARGLLVRRAARSSSSRPAAATPRTATSTPTATARASARSGSTARAGRRRSADAAGLESPGDEVLDSPDNVTVTPRGGLLLCEDDAPARRRHAPAGARASRTSTGSSASRRTARRSTSRVNCFSDERARRHLLQPGRQDDVRERLRGVEGRRPSTPGRA